MIVASRGNYLPTKQVTCLEFGSWLIIISHISLDPAEEIEAIQRVPISIEADNIKRVLEESRTLAVREEERA